MPMVHVLCAIDSFRLEPGAGGAGPRLRLDGWHLSHGRTRSIALALADADGRESELAIEERDLPDAGVAAMHGGAFGEAATRARFRLSAPLPADSAPLAGELRVTLEDGVRLRYPLGAPEAAMATEAAAGPDGSAAEAALVARFVPCGDPGAFERMRRGFGIEDPAPPGGATGADAFALASRIERRLADSPGRDMDAAARGAFLAALDDPARVLVFDARAGGRAGRDGRIGMERLYEAMRAAGRARLLWVTAPVPGRAGGTAVRVRTGLLHGIVPEAGAGADGSDAEGFERDGWLAVLRAAAAALEPADA